MDYIKALLTERPNDIDFELLPKTNESKFIVDYFNKFGDYPSVETYETEFNTKLTEDVAPWKFYEEKLKSEKFIRDALPYLTKFNEMYDKDQKQAILHLRDKLMSLTDPEVAELPISIVKNLDRYEHFKNQTNARIKTGIAPLDEASGGISKKDEFMIISARLGIGKSWLAHFICAAMTLSGYRVGLYSGEMSEDEVGARFDSIVSHISNYALTRGRDIDLEEHKTKLAGIEGDFLVLTAKQLRHNATPNDLRRFAKQNEIDVLFIDQLSLMEPDGMRNGEDYERKARLSFQLKSLQQELQIPIVGVNQLNRAAAQQEADASNLSGSDRIGQDATLILALSRKEDTLKIKVLKARSFRIPDQPWEFTWDIDKGILEPKLSAMDAVKAKITQAKATEVAKEAEARAAAQQEEESDELW